MPPGRLRRIVAQANALHPDIVLIAGDFISDRWLKTRAYTYREALASLADIKAPLGSVAVLGNHDYWRGPRGARTELERLGVAVLVNSAVRRGPLAVGGLDYDFTRRGSLQRTLPQLRRLGGAPVMLAHSPDLFPRIPADIPLMLAGHTHCGQIRLPLIGALATNSRYGQRYACGLVRENGRTLVVTAGLGVSVLPFRFGAVPDMWLITLRPPEG
jgi:predicted MPP superfamily phosphohydrolase